MYIPYYIKFNKGLNTNTNYNNSTKLENFQVEKDALLTDKGNIPTQCVEDEPPTLYFEDGHEIERCLVSHDNSTVTTPVINDSDVKLYYFDGEKTHMFIDDFFDNFTKIVLYVKFNESEDNLAVLIQSKYYKVEWKTNDLIITYYYSNTDNTKHIIHTINNVSITNFNEITIDQSKRDKKVYFRFREFNSEQEDVGSPIEYTDNMIKEHKCDYSKGNEIYIGCDKKKTDSSFIEAFIGIKELKINKSKHDSFVYTPNTTGMTIKNINQRNYPTSFACNTTTIQAIWRESDDTPEPTTSQTLGIYENYLEIMMNTIIVDLKLFYKESLNIDNTKVGVGADDKATARFFSKLVPKEENVSNPARLFLKNNKNTDTKATTKVAQGGGVDKSIQTYIFKGYDNRTEKTHDYIGYYFSLNDEYNRELVNYFDFLDLKGIQKRFKEFNECHMLILGNRSKLTSYFQFLRLNKAVFVLVFKNNEDISYNYEIVNIKLDRYYEIQQEFYKYSVQNDSSTETEHDYMIAFFKNIYTGESKSKFNINADLSAIQDAPEGPFKPNLLSLYSKYPNFNASLNFYKDGVMENKKYVNYYSDFSMKTCDFKPSGETPFECRQLCMNDNKPNCNLVRCSNICNDCETADCKWKLLDLREQKKKLPNQIKVKGFSGNGKIKLSWIKPDSYSPIKSYYIIVESSKSPGMFDLYIYKGKEDLVEYVVSNLVNGNVYLIYVLAKNEYGIGDISNKVTLIPNKNKVLDMEDLGTDTYSDSLQNFYKSERITINVVEEIKKYEDAVDINEIKQVLLEQMSNGLDKSNYTINMF